VRQKGFDFEAESAREKAPEPRPPAPEPRPPAAKPRPGPRRGLTVTALTERIRDLLETEFLDVWVEGEVSNLRVMPSGHWYFTLKDQNAQIRAVVFKKDARYVRFQPKDGAMVVARGAVRLYPPRGEYQISVQVLEPLGKGSLQQAFEDLKEKLEKEGLFAAERKRPLPMLPRRIGIVTSPQGAVLRDILHVLAVRYSNLEVIVYPCRVQGPEASAEIVRGIRALNTVAGLDVLVVARGGGSLEDLWPFNEERVARALAASAVPTISAVGHETDYTIADFVADLRAPTPSAAAERVVQAKADLAARVSALERHLHSAMRLRVTRTRARVEAFTSHRVFEAERGRIRNFALRVDDLGRRAETALGHRSARARDRLRGLKGRLEAFRFDLQVRERRARVGSAVERLSSFVERRLARGRADLARHAETLEALSPLGVLGRGYALVWDASERRLIRTASQVEAGDALKVRLHEGRLEVKVTSKENP
jgi:exodeoxyribonuclease VII large subunit